MRINLCIRVVGAMLTLAQLPTSLFGMGEVVLCRSAIGHEQIEVKHVNPCQKDQGGIVHEKSNTALSELQRLDEHCVDEPLSLEIMVDQKNRSTPVLAPVIVLYCLAVPAKEVTADFSVPVYVFSPDSIESLVQSVTLLI